MAPENSSQQARVEHPDHTQLPDETQAFEAWLWDERNRWSVRQHQRGGLFGRKLDKAEADRALRRLLDAVAREGGAL